MYNVNYQADGLDNYFHVAARRSGELLLVSFTDTADQPRTAVEVALRESQATEKAARADAEQQRQRFHEVLMQLPAHVAVYHGPDHVYQLVNPPYQRLFPGRSFAGRPFREGMPEAVGLGVVALFDRVYHTGEPYYARELEGWFDFRGTGQPEQVFLNLYLHPLRSANGQVDGVLDFSYDVTEQVRARQQLQQLNQELESRVAARTQEADAARAEAEEQRNRLLRLFNQAPAHINLFAGPEHVLTLVHPATAALLSNRPLLGLTRRQALPELPEETHAPFDEVYRTGQPRYVHERLSRLDLHNDGVLHDVYFDVTFQPMFDAAGHIEGLMSFAVNVTERVRIRRQAEALQAEMANATQLQAREREAFFQVFEQTPALVQLLHTARHRITYVNPAYQQLFPGRRLVGLPLADALPELQEQGFGALLDHVYQTGETYFGIEVPVQIPVTDQPPRAAFFTFTYQAFREAGEIAGISVFAYEVTEQVQARQQEEEGREALRRFKFMADQARDAFILMRQDGSFAYLNPQALAAWGYTEAEARHLRVPDVDVNYEAHGFAQLFAQTQHTPIAALQTQHRHRDGHVFPVQVSLSSLQLEGQPHLLAVARDVTAQQHATDALRESEARFRIMADAAPNHVWAVNPDTTIRYVNRAFLDFVGMSLEEYMHVGWASFMHPDELAGAQQVLETAIEPHGPYTLEHRMRRHDGQYRWLLAQGAPSFYANGELYGYVGSAIDITELKHTNEQLTRTNADLDNFIYTASHDLKAPITNIEGLLNALREHLPPPQQADSLVLRLLAMMQGAVERFQLTLAQLADISALQQAHLQPSGVADLAAVVAAVRLDLAPLLETTRPSCASTWPWAPPCRSRRKTSAVWFTTCSAMP